LLFAELALAITPAIRKRMRADVARLLPASAQPSAGQWKMIFSTAITTCVVAGAGSGKSSSLALRVLLLVHYLNVPLDAISVITFTRASREDFAQRLVRLFALWALPLTLGQARARVTTFHATVLGWARSLPGFAQLRAFESLGAAEDAGNVFQLRITDAQREQLNRCYHSLMATDAAFAQGMQALRQRASQLPRLGPSHPEVQKRLSALVPAAQRDAELCEIIEAHWRQAGHWPIPGVEPATTEHTIEGQRFRCHGYLRASDTWVMLGADPTLGDTTRPGARLPVRAEWAVKRTLFQALFDKPLIWLDSFERVSAINTPGEVQGPGFDFCLAGERGAQPVLEAFAAMAGFIENLGLEVPTAAAYLGEGDDGLFFQALGRYWPALERQLLAQVPPVLSYNRMFALFTDPHGSALARLPLSKLTALRHLLVDEFQDISPQIAQWLRAGLAERLRREAANCASLMCVGDDWQSIYGWRGSSPTFFVQFATAFPAPSTRRLMLKENFRSTQQVIDAAEFIVTPAASIPGKKAVAAGSVGPRVQVRWKDPQHIAQVAQAAIDAGRSLLVLYRQAKDDPRTLAPLGPLLAAQSQLPPEQRLMRCMTIHGAKGLEAQVVIMLGDCTARPASPARNLLYTLAGLAEGASADPYDQAQRDEALRLAYVGITRAAHSLYWYLDKPAQGWGPSGASARAVDAPELFDDCRV
jgi:hypothetical protein